jgi:hypothetical protein
MLIAGVIGAAGVTLRGLLSVDLDVAYLARALQLLIPLALGIGFMRSRMARAAVADLVTVPDPARRSRDLEAAVRRALHDRRRACCDGLQPGQPTSTPMTGGRPASDPRRQVSAVGPADRRWR